MPAGSVAQFVYENANGLRITLFAARIDNSQMAAFTYKKNGKINSFYWPYERMRYAIVGQLGRDQLNTLAVQAYQAFS